jgi:DNA excision repair protein ERCC-2
MGEQYQRQPGNYLAFFSSFDYMEKAAALFAEKHPGVPVWLQTRRMDEAGREQFLARFSAGSSGIGFAVLGGSFGEGIDLPGTRLIGAFIATLGLPQLNPVNEQTRQRMDAIFGSGYDYTYTYPGMQKIVQAAGRVIRTETDRGTIYLIDDRYARPEIQALLPSWWSISSAQPRQ